MDCYERLDEISADTAEVRYRQKTLRELVKLTFDRQTLTLPYTLPFILI